MAETDIIQTLLQNPQFAAAILAIVWNIGGYITKAFQMKQLEKYQWQELAKTLVLFETLFLILTSVGGLPASSTTAIAIILVFIKSLANAINDYTAALKATS